MSGYVSGIDIPIGMEQKKDMNWYDVLSTVWPLNPPITLTLDFQDQNFK